MAAVISGFTHPAPALNGADVALYNDAAAPYFKGAWPDGLTAFRNMLTTLGLTYEEIDYWDLDTSTQEFSDLYKVILMPGGYAPYFNYWINPVGKERIRAFVQAGGAYLGVCAGAYFACDTVVWGTNVYDDAAGYDLDLFPGSGVGDLDSIIDYYTGNWTMTTFNFTNANSILHHYKTTPYTEDIIFLGGPSFTNNGQNQFTVLATFATNGKPGIIAFNYGLGRVILSGAHPEIEEDSDRDGVTLNNEDELNDRGSDWEFTLYLLAWLADPQADPIMDLPTGQTTFSYAPVAEPTRSTTPAAAQPLSLGPAATNGNTFALGISVDQFMTPVDMYLGYYDVEDPATIYIIRPDYTFQELTAGLVPWKASVLDPVAENSFGNIPISAIRQGTYTIGLLVAPAGNLDTYYLWTTTLSIP